MTLPPSTGEEPVTDAAVREELDRVLASAAFAGSLRLRRFLRYVVEQQLAGEGARLKEYAIGVEVFDRQGQYDPRIDSIVRVEAGRLRSKIDEYYAGEGAADEIRITLQRGGYVPTFARRAPGPAIGPSVPPEQSPAQASRTEPSRRPTVVMLAAAALLIVGVAAGWRSLASGPATGAAPPGISIAVLPFDEYSGTESDIRLADRMTDELTTALARLGKLSVVSRTSARQFQGVRRPMHEIAEALGAQVILEAAIEPDGDGLLIQPRLVDATIDRKFWVGRYRGSRTDLRDLASRMAAGVTEAVLQRQTRR